MKRAMYALLTATIVAAMPLSAQNTAPVLNFDSAPTPLVLPDDIYLGEVGGVATNSRGDIFVYTRTGHPTMSMGTSRAFVHGGSRLFQFDRSGKFTREIGQGLYGFLFAAQVRVDPQDNIWVVDEMSAMVMKLDPQGRVAFLLGLRRLRPGAAPLEQLLAAVAAGLTPRHRRVAADAVVLRERADNRTSSTARPTSRGTRRATSSSPTAAATRGSPSSRRTASS